MNKRGFSGIISHLLLSLEMLTNFPVNLRLFRSVFDNNRVIKCIEMKDDIAASNAVQRTTSLVNFEYAFYFFN